MNEINTYLTFDGNCREAMECYKKCLGAELFLMPFSEAPVDFPKEAKELSRPSGVAVTGFRWRRA